MKSLGLHNRAHLMFRHGSTAINFIRQRWFSSLLNTTRKVCLSLSLLIWMEPQFIFLQLSPTWVSPSTRISFFSNMSPTLVNSAILNCVESILSVTTCHKMLSRYWSLLLSCPESFTAILCLLAVLSSSFTNFKKFRTTLQGSSVKLLSLIIYLLSFTLFTGFLLNKELNTNCFSLPSNL